MLSVCGELACFCHMSSMCNPGILGKLVTLGSKECALT